MQTVAQAMQSFISGLEIPSCPHDAPCGSCLRCKAERQRDAIRGHLEGELAVSEFRISGSFKRRTALRPLHDIDLFIVLNPDTERQLRESKPAAVLRRVQEILQKAYPTKERPKAQSRSVNVSFTHTGLDFDVVPAFSHPASGYVIPDRDADAWIRTDPPLHAKHSTDCNERAGKMAKPIVKALKHWNRRQDIGLRSFHLEMMVYDQLTSPPKGYADGFARALRGMASRIGHRMPEPAGVGPDVDAGMSSEEREKARAALAAAADTAERAHIAATRGHVGEAHHHWRSLFGEEYPEKGTPPAKGGPSIVVASGGSAAPDPQSRRFG